MENFLRKITNFSLVFLCFLFYFSPAMAQEKASSLIQKTTNKVVKVQSKNAAYAKPIIRQGVLSANASTSLYTEVKKLIRTKKGTLQQEIAQEQERQTGATNRSSSGSGKGDMIIVPNSATLAPAGQTKPTVYARTKVMNTDSNRVSVMIDKNNPPMN